MSSKQVILITGGSGMIGKAMTSFLMSKGFEVRHLLRRKTGRTDIKEFIWNIDKGQIDQEAFIETDVIIHLAGSNVGSGRWTKSKKKEILESRTLATRLLIEQLSKTKHGVKKLISASAIGYYGTNQHGHLFTEEEKPGTDFMAQVCVAWENELLKINIPKVIYRLGVVLSNDGGALPKMTMPVRMGVGVPIGRGSQPVPWIHIDDVCHAFLLAIEQESVTGVYNLVAPEQTTNAEMMKSISSELKKLYLPLGVPGFLLKLMLGEQSVVVLEGAFVSPQKLINTGFKFEYKELSTALSNLLSVKSKNRG